jgi:tripartite-type tricarboxylate transporter receptor subunit TctC
MKSLFSFRAAIKVASACGMAVATTMSMSQTNAGADWPSKPVTIILGFPSGSGVDTVARTIQAPLSKLLGQPVIIDYKVGAAGNIASEYVSRAQADGYTLVLGTAATHGSNAALYKKLPFDVESDFVPVAPVLDVSNVLAINADVVPARTLKEFVDLVKANPGKYNYASTGIGAGTHMAFAEFNSRLGLEMTHVAYKGGPEALLSVMRGETCCIMNQVQTILTQHEAGKVRLLALTTARTVGVLPDVPPIASSGLPNTSGFDSSTWFGVFAPKGTPPAIVNKLNAAINIVIQHPEIRSRFESQGNSLRVESPAQFKQTVRDNRTKWAEVVKAAAVEAN